MYGAGTVFREDRELEAPLNIYGYSKYLFDQYVRRALPERTAQIAGFRYFNVYGPREAHKGRMASRGTALHDSTRREGRVQLFRGIRGGYRGDGEHRRDFIHVDDVVRGAICISSKHRERAGMFNLGTGNAAPFNASRLRRSMRPPGGRRSRPSARGVVARRRDRVHADADALVGKYQSFTQADMSRLRAAGYAVPMLAVDKGVARYVESLMSDSEPGS